MKRTYLVLVAVLVCCGAAALAFALTPGEASSAPVATPSASVESEVVPAFSLINCEFDCEDGYGFGFACSDPSLAVCCTYGETACADHGGMVDGICWKGRLGLPCVPF